MALSDDLVSGNAERVRSAAKKIRRAPASDVVDALQSAIRMRIGKSEQWETIYHLLMALGACRDARSAELIAKLVRSSDLGLEPMAYVGLGAAWAGVIGPAKWAEFSVGKMSESFVEGVILGCALFKADVTDEVFVEMARCVARHRREWSKLYLVAIAARLRREVMLRFLHEVDVGRSEQLADAVQKARIGKVVRLYPL